MQRLVSADPASPCPALPLRSAVLGKGDLALQCSEVLLSMGHEIAAIASPSLRLRTWAGEHRIAAVESLAQLLATIDLGTVDYLFSIINPEILPAAVLGLPRKLAINYHNSPLPKYAGVFATSWAILNDEREHGITWHVMDAKVDTGDILRQVRFSIADDETTLSLNVKCHEHAAAAFADLAGDLTHGELRSTRQDLQKRSFFASHRKAPGAGFLSWDASAEELDRLVRALHFGDSPNRLGVAKLVIGNHLFAVDRLVKLNHRSNLPPGTAVEIAASGLLVSTATTDVRIASLRELAGGEVSAPELARRLGFVPGDRFPVLSRECLSRCESELSAASANERYWQAQLLDARPLDLAALGLRANASGGTIVASSTLPPAAAALDARPDHLCTPGVAGLAAVLFDLARETGARKVTAGIPALRPAASPPFAELLAPRVPLTLDLRSGDTFAVLVDRLALPLREHRIRGTVLRDLGLRHPLLRGRSASFALSANLRNGAASGSNPTDSRGILHVEIDPETSVLRLVASVDDESRAEVRALLHRILRRTTTLLLNAALAPHRAAADLPIVNAIEVQQLIREWNDTALARPSGEPAHRLFERQVRTAPGAIAILGERTLTYGELDAEAEEIADRLDELGIGSGNLVPVHAHRSPELVAAILGILKVGAAYVPLDPVHPPERLAKILEDCAPRALLLGRDLEHELSDWRGARLVLDTARRESDGGRRRRSEVAPEALAYVMFTSGSTGRPKGVLSPHLALSNRLLWGRDAAALGPDDRVLQVLTIGFDVSVGEILLPLVSGATLVIAEPERHRDPSYLVEVIRRFGVTMFHTVPSLLRSFLHHPESRLCRTLRYVVSGGEALTAELAQRFAATLPARLCNAYGPTEATVSVAHWIAEPSIRPTLGRPMANCELLVLDAALRPLPIGSVGELLIGGAPLSQGYLADPVLTALRFMPHPFARKPGERLYRTGDLARFLSDANIEFLGRRDGQVKVRGIRVELAEIEALLERRPEVAQAVVTYHETEPGDGQLIAYLRCTADDETVALLRSELRKSLAKSLPAALVPSFFVFLAELPLLSSGKVNRASLPRPELTDHSGGEGYSPPRNGIELQLCAAWSEILKLPLLGIFDNIFHLGGHSIHATRMKLWLREKFGVDLPLRTVFEYPTVERLAQRLEEACRSRAESAEEALAAPAGPRLPLSFAQARVWFLDSLHLHGCLYNVPMAVKLAGPLAPAALARSLARVAAHHDALRTRIVLHDGEPFQEVSTDTRFALPQIDLRTLPEPRRAAEGRRLVELATFQPFDLATGSLLRVWLVRLEAQDDLLACTTHHIAFDGWSATIFWRDLGTNYNRELRGLPPIEKAATQRYSEFALRQRERLQGASLDRLLDYWEAELSGVPDLDLPTDFPRSKRLTLRGAVRHFRLASSLALALRDLERQLGATRFMLLLAAFDILLHRWSGADDLAVGAPFSGRREPQLAEQVGMFVNTVALRSRLPDNPSFRAIVERTREATFGATEHEEAPFERVVERLRRERSPNRHPVFQVMFALNRDPVHSPALSGVTATPLSVPARVSMFDLTATFEERHGEITGEIEYSTELLTSVTVERMIGSLKTLLAAVATNPALPARHAPLLSASGCHQILREWNDTGALALPREPTVERWFAVRARATPERIAIESDRESLTYAALDARAGRIAARLLDFGVKPEDRVLVLAPRSAWQIASVFGILRAGAAYVPVDPQTPALRLRGIAEETGAVCGLALAGQLATIPQLATPVLAIDAETPGEVGGAGPPFSPAAEERGLAYVLYTSGSGGRPKGVQVEHHSLCNYALGAWRAFALDAEDRMLQFASLAFDTAAEEIFPILMAGGTLVLRDDSMLERIDGFFAFCRRHCVTIVDLPTAYFHLLAGEISSALEPPSELRLIVVGGERLLAEPLARWWHVTGATDRAKILNTYGPTEATIVATSAEVGPERNGGGGEPPLGRPVANAVVRLFDRTGEPTLVGATGELFLGGTAVARGYLGRPEETAERFVPDPFSAAPGARLYRTGDLARWMADGQLEFVGRQDRQVKLRGYRVEPDEIEALLAQQREIREAAVVAQGEDPQALTLVAFVVARGEEIDFGEIRRSVERSLPAYMVPARWARLDVLPRLISGKVDRAALAREALTTSDAQSPDGTDLDAPFERDLARIWSQLLGIPSVSVGDNFFSVGGHSLLGIRLLSRLRAHFGIELPLAKIFLAPTLAAMAREIAAKLNGAYFAGFPPIGPRPPGTAAPLTPAQRRIWFLDAAASVPGLYNLPAVYRLRGETDPAALERALVAVAERHELLRMAIRIDGGRPTLEVAPRLARRLALVDLSALPVDVGRRVALPVLESAGLQPFALDRAPLWRSVLARRGPSEHLLLLSAHHLIADGWSMDLLRRDLCALYSARRDEARTVLSVPVQYGDFSVWSEQWFAGSELLRDQLAFWLIELEGATDEIELPFDRPRSDFDPTGRSARLFLRHRETERLRALGRTHDATLFMTVHSLFSLLLHRLAQQDDLTIGTPVANRHYPGVEETFGLFVNMLALRSRTRGERSFGEHLRATRTVTLAALAHRDLPFERLVEALHPERSLERSPVFQVVSSLEERASSELGKDLDWEEISLVPRQAKFDLALAARETEDELELRFETKRSLFDATTLERLAAAYATLLDAAFARPEDPVACLPLLTAAEIHQTLTEWSSSTPSAFSGPALHRLFERRTALNPDAVAVTDGGRETTYAALDAAADRLARQLAASGVEPEVTVGVHLDRSTELVMAILAIWKAGGVYVPLDPANPSDRTALMIEDAAVRVVISDRPSELKSGGFTGAVLPPRTEPSSSRAYRTVEVDLDGAAYLFFTSGSTGRPKGVVVPHRGIANRVLRSTSDLAAMPDDAILQNAQIGFDISLWEIFHPLVAGARLVICPPGSHRDPRDLLALLRDEQITQVHLVPSLLELMLAEDSAPDRPFDRLRGVVCGGESLSAEALRRFAATAPALLCHAYGPTEASISVAHWRLPAGGSDELARLARVPLGRPLAGARLLVLDRQLRPLPVGVAGEMFIGGAPLARGYFERPDLTAGSFLPDPWSPVPGARVYRTGDRARHLPDGRFEFLGRTDRQVKIRGHRIELGEVEAALSPHPAVRQAVVDSFTDRVGRIRLAAWVVARSLAAEGGEVELGHALRSHLELRLPAAMVPSSWVFLAELPLLATGKVDRRALPKPELEAPVAPAGAAPRDELEALFARLWREILGIDRVGIHDNFFAVGGDSIASIQIVSRARQSGLEIDLQQFFHTPTVAGLAAAARQRAAPLGREAVERPAAGLRLAPAQERFFARRLAVPEHFAQSVLLEPAVTISRTTAHRALDAVAVHHPALRLAFAPSGEDGGWRQGYAPPAPLAWSEVDLSRISATRTAFELATFTQALQGALDPMAGLCFRAAWIDLGATRDRRLLLLAAHHLVTDATSWQILLEDLGTALDQIASNRPIELPAVSEDFTTWAEALAVRWSDPVAAEVETAFWEAVIPGRIPPLPLDDPAGRDFEADSETLTCSADAELTRQLIEESARAYGTRPVEVLIAAIAAACADVFSSSGLLIELEGHGRLPFPDFPEVSRTVGWFTAVHPLWIEVPSGVEACTAGTLLRETKESVRRVPAGGCGFGALRYGLNGPIAARLAALPEPQVSFNYLGASLAAPRVGARIEPSRERPGAAVSAANARERTLEVVAALRNGRLEVTWTFGREQLERRTIERLAERFLARLGILVAEARRAEAFALTPSDFPLARVDQETLDGVVVASARGAGGIRAIEDAFPLAPMQAGFLFQSLLRPGASTYLTQIVFELSGAVLPTELRTAWCEVVARQPALRTYFLWQDLAEPLQIVLRTVALSWSELDWRAVPCAERAKRRAELLHADRERGLNLASPPLQRFTFISLAEDRSELIWTHHHILLDGWSLPRVWEEVVAEHRRLRRGAPTREVPRARPFRDYVTWLARWDRTKSEAFWRTELTGVSEPFLLAAGGAPATSDREDSPFVLILPIETTEQLRRLARGLGITLSTVLQGAWALLLARYTRRDEVLFGVSVSGRPPELPGVEEIVGLFINTVPLRIRCDADLELPGYLRTLSARVAQIQDHSYLPLVKIQACAHIPRGQALFDTLLVFENYPLARVAASGRDQGDLQVESVSAIERTEYPLTLTILPAEQLRIELSYSGASFDPETIASLAGFLERILEAFAGAA